MNKDDVLYKLVGVYKFLFYSFGVAYLVGKIASWFGRRK